MRFSLQRKNIGATQYNFQTEAGFKNLYEQHWEKVFAVCYHHTAQSELAKEMTQDIFLSIWSRKASLKIQKSLEGYLVRAAKLKVAEHFRNQATRTKHFQQATQDLPVAINTTEQDVAFTFLTEKVEELVNQLSPRCKEVFQMSRNQGLSNLESAQHLQISQRAVEQHISKALNYLKDKLAHY